MGFLWFFVCFSDYLSSPTEKTRERSEKQTLNRFSVFEWEESRKDPQVFRFMSSGWKTNCCPFIHLSVCVVERSSNKTSRAPWKIKQCWQTQVVFKKGSMWLRASYKRWRRNSIRCASSDHFPPSHRPSSLTVKNEHEKQLESSAICRWPFRNINFLLLHLSLNVFAERLGLLHHMLFDTLLLFPGPRKRACFFMSF